MYKYYLIILILILLIIVNKSFENFNSPTNNCNYLDYQLAKQYFYNNRECKKLTTKGNCNNQDRCVWAANTYNNTEECIDIDSNNLDTDYKTIIDCNKLDGKMKEYLTNNEDNINKKICNLNNTCKYSDNKKCVNCNDLVYNLINDNDVNFKIIKYGDNIDNIDNKYNDHKMYLIQNNDNNNKIKIIAETNITDDIKCLKDNFTLNSKQHQSIKEPIDESLKCAIHIDNTIYECNNEHKYYIYKTNVFDNLNFVFSNDYDNDIIAIKKQIYWKNIMYYDLLKTTKDDYIDYTDFIAINKDNEEYLYYIFKDKPVYADLTNCKLQSDNKNIFYYLKQLKYDESQSSVPTTNVPNESNLYTMNEFKELNPIDIISLFKPQSNYEDNNKLSIKPWGSKFANGTILQRTGKYKIINDQQGQPSGAVAP
jgi:hypothetical protein